MKDENAPGLRGAQGTRNSWAQQRQSDDPRRQREVISHERSSLRETAWPIFAIHTRDWRVCRRVFRASVPKQVLLGQPRMLPLPSRRVERVAA
eukprot:6208789-Pleurochrysis_carterae.AAC.2